MLDNEIKREMTFSEELPYFKELIKEVFDNYHNPDGGEDPLHISVLRDSNRIVRKAEEEIARQQAENKRLEKEVNLVSIQFQDLQERYEESQAEIERLKKEVEDKERAYNDEFCLRKEWRSKCQELLKEKQTIKSEAIKEFAEELKKRANRKFFETLDHVSIIEIDDLVEEMVGE